jgi:hypothetical protein
MDHGFLAITVTIFSLDDGRGLGLALLDHGRAVTIPIAIAMLADSHACADGTDANADLIGQCGRCERANNPRGEKILLHSVLLIICSSAQ